MPANPEDRDLTLAQVQSLSSADALAAFFAYLGYPGESRLPMTTEALGLSADLARAVKHVERLASVEQGALEVYLFELKSVTVALTRALARAFRDRIGNYLLVVTDDYDRLDFVLLERVLPEQAGQGLSRKGITLRPRPLTVDRRNPNPVVLRVLRRFTLTEFDTDGEPDPYAQYDKLQSAYVVAEWSEPLFNNRALFSDYYLNERLRSLPEWDEPSRNQAFRDIRGHFANARQRFNGLAGPDFRQQVSRPLLETLGFRVEPGAAGSGSDFRLLAGSTTDPLVFMLAYPWGRYLDGKDETRDPERPEENPGGQAVSLLEAGEAPWAIVTNGKLWRLYSARAHSRATNYYEIDLEETLASPAPAEAFRYFYLFFRAAAFMPVERRVDGEARELSFLDWLLDQSAAYAQELGERLKERVFEDIFPHFAEGFIRGLGGSERLLALPETERAALLDDVFQGTLTFLYRLLFLLYAESRDLLPVREVRGYHQICLHCLKEDVAEQAKTLADQAPAKIKKAYSATETKLYDRLLELFRVIDRGDAARNVPIYNGGLFMTDVPPEEEDTSNKTEVRTARFLLQTKIPDRYLALGLDLLARDVDPRRGDLVFIDYKSLGVRQLGSIYEGLLEFKVRLATREMAVVKGKKTEEVIPLAELPGSSKTSGKLKTLPRGAVYLENDRRERKATGSYYTPDYIVKYIVQHTVGPVLEKKFEALRSRLPAVEKRFREAVQRKQAVEKVTPDRPELLADIAGDILRDLFDVKVLDPAMGSGHFLVEAVDYVTDRLVRFLEGFPFLGYFFEGMRRGILAEMERQAVSIDPDRLTDVTLLKRHVLKRCIYGVDLNPMAVELAKVSLWLDCFTLGAPLSFLDHHLRRGNSLIGASARQAEAEMAGPSSTGQMTFLTGPFVGLLRAAEIMRGISQLTDVTLSEVHQSEQLFKEFDRAARPYKQLLDVYVARHFGVKRADEFLRLYGAEVMEADPSKLGKPYADVLRETRQLYQAKRFFHWDLEFPEVFIDLDRAEWKENGGFDAVVGNPPYGVIEDKQYLAKHLSTTGQNGDVYVAFLEQSLRLTRRTGFVGFIIPLGWQTGVNYSDIRNHLLRGSIVRVVNLPFDIFPDAYVDTGLAILKNQAFTSDTLTLTYAFPKQAKIHNLDALNYHQVVQSEWLYERTTIILDPVKLRLIKRLLGTESTALLGSLTSSVRGILARSDEDISDTKKGEHWRPFFVGEFDRYVIEEPELFILFGDNLKERPASFHVFTGPRVLVRRLVNRQDRLMATAVEETFVNKKDIYVFRTTGVDWNYKFLLSLVNSRLLSFAYLEADTAATKDDFRQTTLDGLRSLPIRRIHFVTSAVERRQRLGELIQEYQDGQNDSLLTSVEELLPRDEYGDFLAFAPASTGTEEKSDVVHDLLAHLAQQMINLNKAKQAEQKRFLGWLEAALKLPGSFKLPGSSAGAGLDALTGKTKIFGYLGDYQKDEPETLWEEIEDVLFRNRRRIGANLNDLRFINRLKEEYEKSLETLRPIKAQLARTDWLIDQVVYRLYGLTEEEIKVVEGE